MLKYPHHGNASLDTNLLNVMTPKYVIIPNYNYTQFPSSSDKSKLSKVGASIYQNGKDGNIVLTSDGNNISIKTKQNASSYKR
jgi:beta-lactamase superfamily II metal-dependent hydrolase